MPACRSNGMVYVRHIGLGLADPASSTELTNSFFKNSGDGTGERDGSPKDKNPLQMTLFEAGGDDQR
jgi:hypothetical protein